MDVIRVKDIYIKNVFMIEMQLLILFITFWNHFGDNNISFWFQWSFIQLKSDFLELIFSVIAVITP